MKSQSVAFTVLAAAAICMAGVACTTKSDKAGGDASPTILRMATMEGRGAPYTFGVEEFARQVEDLSGGALRIEIVWNGAAEFFGAYRPTAEQDVAGLVQSGKLDSALVPARAWDELGVRSFQALQAPFLVSNEELVEQIVDSELAEEMLGRLDETGVVGLTLLPEGLRHPVGFVRPFLTAEDFSGAAIRAPRSNASYQLLKALDAKPVEICCDEFSQAVARGEIAGAESGFAWGGDLPRPGIFTANVTFYPKVNAIVVNADRFGSLSDEHRETLRDAAARTRRQVLRHVPSEADLAEVYCRNGGTIAVASAASLAALERAAQPVYAALQSDPKTSEFIAQIRRMKGKLSGAPTPLPDGCGPASGAAVPTTSTSSETAVFPEGLYRADLTATDLIEKGLDPRTAYALAGIVTLTFEDGKWRAQTRGVADCGGTYSVAAGRISLRHDVAQCGEAAGTIVMTARWAFEDGELRFFDVRRGRPLEWGSKPWKKID